MRKMSMVVSLLLVSGVAAAHTGSVDHGQGVAAQSDVARSAVRMEQGVMVAAGKKTKTAEAAPKAEEPKAEVAAESTLPGEYKPKTQFDNTPYRFNMNQNGKKMTAEEFDAWMKSRGIRVAKGAPGGGAQPAAAQGGAQVASDAKGK
ncbi:hypothetical protein AB4Y64_16465 [Lysobacter sp. TAF61]|uniref:hypothetical protein n=1 Tax=Lysobacter sp. TAF61 TaxID=3233072 RepID=UPI003F9C678C